MVLAMTDTAQVAGRAPNRSRVARLLRQPITWVVGLYALATSTIVASTGLLPIIDDWMYVRGAQQFAADGSIVISDQSIPNAIFESVVGGAAITVFGDSLDVLVAVSIVLSAAAALALNDLVIRSGGHAIAGATAAAAYLFGPMAFGLSLTYMTDIHGLALAVIAAALYSRGVDETPVPWLIYSASVVVALAYLSRPGAAAVILGALWVLVSRRDVANLIRSAAIPIVVLATHSISQAIGGVPEIRRIQAEAVALPDWNLIGDTVLALIVQVGLLGLVFVPAAAAIVASAVRSRRINVPLLAVTIAAAFAVIVFGPPPSGDWLSVTGLLPLDNATIGYRLRIISPVATQALVVALAVAAGAVLALALRRRQVTQTRSAFIGLWLGGAVALVLTLVGPAQTYDNIHDRYLIVLFPAILLSIASGWTARPSRTIATATAIAVAVLAITSSLLAVDGFRIQTEIWHLADSATVVANDVTDVDGGAAWTGWHMGHLVDPDEISLPTGGEWWRQLFGPRIDPRFVVSLLPSDGACTIDSVSVPRILGAPQGVLLLDTEC